MHRFSVHFYLKNSPKIVKIITNEIAKKTHIFLKIVASKNQKNWHFLLQFFVQNKRQIIGRITS